MRVCEPYEIERNRINTAHYVIIHSTQKKERTTKQNIRKLNVYMSKPKTSCSQEIFYVPLKCQKSVLKINYNQKMPCHNQQNEPDVFKYQF